MISVLITLKNKVFILHFKAIKTKMCYKLRDKINPLDLINRWLRCYCGSLGVKVRNDSYSRSR